MTIASQPKTDNGVVRAFVDIAASPEDVFKALTDSRELAAWLGGVDDYTPGGWNDDAAPGMAWRSPAIAPDGTRGTVRGELLVVDAPRRIVTTWHASWDHFARTLVRYELAPTDVNGVPGTRLTVTHTAPAAYLQHVSHFGAVRDGGWTALLARLSRLMSERLTV
jgi:uncharacterized protein YndB with AHSA1/START domain